MNALLLQYALQHLPNHLIQAGRKNEALALLTDFDFEMARAGWGAKPSDVQPHGPGLLGRTLEDLQALSEGQRQKPSPAVNQWSDFLRPLEWTLRDKTLDGFKALLFSALGLENGHPVRRTAGTWLEARVSASTEALDWVRTSRLPMYEIVISWEREFIPSLLKRDEIIGRLGENGSALQLASDLASHATLLSKLSHNASTTEPYLRCSIACYEAALRVRTEAVFPMQWAATQNNLGAAYSALPAGDRAENLSKAIACCEAALRVYTEADFPMNWAMTQNNLGIAYRELPAGDRAGNLSKAIACYEASLRVYTEAAFPLQWATCQLNLGSAYIDLPAGDRAENLSMAIACCEAALRVLTEPAFPMDWARAQDILGVAYRNLTTGDRTENLLRAISCFEAVLRLCTETAYPLQWANTQDHLGNAFYDLSAGERAESISKAIACYEASLRVFTKADFPLEWAIAQDSLGLAYGNLPIGDRINNLSRAIVCFEASKGMFATLGLSDYAEVARQRADYCDHLLRELEPRTFKKIFGWLKR